MEIRNQNPHPQLNRRLPRALSSPVGPLPLLRRRSRCRMETHTDPTAPSDPNPNPHPHPHESFPTVALLQVACRVRREPSDPVGGDSPVFLVDLLSLPRQSIWEMLRDMFISPAVLKLGFRFKQDRAYLSSTFASQGGYDRVLEAFQLKISEDQLMSRCTKCNGSFIQKPLTMEEAIEASKGFQVIPYCLFNRNIEFWQCAHCHQLFWEGTQHHNAVQKFVTVCKLNR